MENKQQNIPLLRLQQLPIRARLFCRKNQQYCAFILKIP